MKYCLDYKACAIHTDDRLIGTEEYQTKIDRTHTTGFMASYEFPRDWVYIRTSRLLNDKIQTMMLFDFRRGSLRAELAVTCTRDQTPTSHVDISATTPRFGPQQLRSGRGDKRSTGPAVLAGSTQGDDSESPMA